MTRRLDCKGEGCEECQVCRYLNFLEWAGQVSGGVPSVIQRNPKLDTIIDRQIEANAHAAVTKAQVA